MFILTPNLNKIPSIFRGADQIWVATALMNLKALNLILDKTKNSCKMKFLVGTALPTEYLALKKLYDLQEPELFEVNIFSKLSYHPKIYISKKNSKYTAVVGSSNCTMGGFENNLEANYFIRNKKLILGLIEWIEKQNKNAFPITPKFLKRYKEIDKKRKARKKKNDKEQKELANLGAKSAAETLEFRKVFLNRLKKWRKTRKYKVEVSERTSTIRNLRSALSFPHFVNIDFDRFYSIRQLGSVLGFTQYRINHNRSKFIKLVKYILDDSISIESRINNTCYNNSVYAISKLGKGLITKLLTISNPKKYFVWNSATDLTLKRYGLQFRRGMSKGQKYRLMCTTLLDICNKTKIQDLSVLDKFLFDYYDRHRYDT